MSVPQSNSTHTMLMPCEVEERTRRTPVAPFTAVSIGNVTSVSTSSGAMPCASVSTVTVGAVRSGNTSTGMRAAVIVPATSSSAAAATTSSRFRMDQRITLSSIGASSVCVAAGEVIAGHGGEAHLVRAGGDDHLARPDAGDDVRATPSLAPSESTRRSNVSPPTCTYATGVPLSSTIASFGITTPVTVPPVGTATCAS
jgi:hypothetical protein